MRLSVLSQCDSRDDKDSPLFNRVLISSKWQDRSFVCLAVRALERNWIANRKTCWDLLRMVSIRRRKNQPPGNMQGLINLIDFVRSGNMKRPDLKGFRVLLWFLIAATLLPQFIVAEWTIIVWFSPFFWIMICAFLWHFAVGRMAAWMSDADIPV